MGSVKSKGSPTQISGRIPQEGSPSPAFQLVASSLETVSLSHYQGQRKILNIFPSIDTGVCAESVRTFNQRAAGLSNTVVLNISQDLPFAQARFCGAEGIDNSETLSAFRSSFAQDFGLEITSGPLQGLCARVVLVLDENDQVIYSEQVPEITEEPSYERAIASLTVAV